MDEGLARSVKKVEQERMSSTVPRNAQALCALEHEWTKDLTLTRQRIHGKCADIPSCNQQEHKACVSSNQYQA